MRLGYGAIFSSIGSLGRLPVLYPLGERPGHGYRLAGVLTGRRSRRCLRRLRSHHLRQFWEMTAIMHKSGDCQSTEHEPR